MSNHPNRDRARLVLDGIERMIGGQRYHALLDNLDTGPGRTTAVRRVAFIEQESPVFVQTMSEHVQQYVGS